MKKVFSLISLLLIITACNNNEPIVLDCEVSQNEIDIAKTVGSLINSDLGVSKESLEQTILALGFYAVDISDDVFSEYLEEPEKKDIKDIMYFYNAPSSEWNEPYLITGGIEVVNMTETEKDKLYKQHIRNGNLYIELAVRFINDSIHYVIMEGKCPFQMNGMDRFYFSLSNSAYDTSEKREFNISTWKGLFNNEVYSNRESFYNAILSTKHILRLDNYAFAHSTTECLEYLASISYLKFDVDKLDSDMYKQYSRGNIFKHVYFKSSRDKIHL